MDKTLNVYFDVTSNIPKGKKALEQEALYVVQRVENNATDIVRRSIRVKPFFTHELGDWSTVYQEAKYAFSMGFFHSTFSLVGMMSEAYCRQLYQCINIKRIDGTICCNNNLFGDNDRIKQSQRINILREIIIDEYVYGRLKYINYTRNKVVYNMSMTLSKNIALKVLNSFIEVLSHRFDDLYELHCDRVVSKMKPTKSDGT